MNKTQAIAMVKRYKQAGIQLTNAEKNLLRYLGVWYL